MCTAEIFCMLMKIAALYSILLSTNPICCYLLMFTSPLDSIFLNMPKIYIIRCECVREWLVILYIYVERRYYRTFASPNLTYIFVQ